MRRHCHRDPCRRTFVSMFDLLWSLDPTSVPMLVSLWVAFYHLVETGTLTLNDMRHRITDIAATNRAVMRHLLQQQLSGVAGIPALPLADVVHLLNAPASLLAATGRAFNNNVQLRTPYIIPGDHIFSSVAGGNQFFAKVYEPTSINETTATCQVYCCNDHHDSPQCLRGTVDVPLSYLLALTEGLIAACALQQLLHALDIVFPNFVGNALCVGKQCYNLDSGKTGTICASRNTAIGCFVTIQHYQIICDENDLPCGFGETEAEETDINNVVCIEFPVPAYIAACKSMCDRIFHHGSSTMTAFANPDVRSPTVDVEHNQYPTGNIESPVANNLEDEQGENAVTDDIASNIESPALATDVDDEQDDIENPVPSLEDDQHENPTESFFAGDDVESVQDENPNAETETFAGGTATDIESRVANDVEDENPRSANEDAYDPFPDDPHPLQEFNASEAFSPMDPCVKKDPEENEALDLLVVKEVTNTELICQRFRQDPVGNIHRRRDVCGDPASFVRVDSRSIAACNQERRDLMCIEAHDGLRWWHRDGALADDEYTRVFSRKTGFRGTIVTRITSNARVRYYEVLEEVVHGDGDKIIRGGKSFKLPHEMCLLKPSLFRSIDNAACMCRLLDMMRPTVVRMPHHIPRTASPLPPRPDGIHYVPDSDEDDLPHRQRDDNVDDNDNDNLPLRRQRQ